MQYSHLDRPRTAYIEARRRSELPIVTKIADIGLSWEHIDTGIGGGFGYYHIRLLSLGEQDAMNALTVA